MVDQISTTAVDRVAKVAAFAHYFGVSRAPASVLIILLEASGKHVAPADIAAQASTTARAVQWHICMLRQVLETESIDFEEGGYSLTEIGVTECRSALAAMRDSLAA